LVDYEQVAAAPDCRQRHQVASPVAGSILSSSEPKTESVEPFLTSHAFTIQTNGPSAATLS
jgi:hypothetical protein